MDQRRADAILAENELLREHVALLQGLLMDVQPLPVAWALTATEARVFGVLVNREIASREAVHYALYGLDPSGGAEIKIVDVMICKIRRKLKPFGITIETRWGIGHALPEPIRARFRVASGSAPLTPRSAAA